MYCRSNWLDFIESGRRARRSAKRALLAKLTRRRNHLGTEMWFRKKSLRRQAVAEDVSESTSLWAWLSRQDRWLVVGTLGFFLAIMALNLIPVAPRYWPAKTIGGTIRAPVTFSVANPARLKALQKAAAARVTPVLRFNTQGHLAEVIENQLTNLPYDVAAIVHATDLPEPLRVRFPVMSQAALDWLHQVVRTDGFHDYQLDVEHLLRELKGHPVVDLKTWRKIARGFPSQALLGVPRAGQPLPPIVASWKLGILGPHGLVFAPLVKRCFPPAACPMIVGYLAALDQPTFVLDTAATTAMVKSREAAVPMPLSLVRQGQVIAHRGEKLTPRLRRLLRAARMSYLRQQQIRHPWLKVQILIGAWLLTAVLVLIGAMYFGGRMRRDRLRHPWAPPLLLLAALAAAKAFAVLGVDQWVYLYGLGSVFLTAIILNLAYGQRLALGLVTLEALLVTIAIHQSLGFFLAAFAGAIALICLLTEIRTRTQWFRMGLLAGAITVAMVFGYGFFHGTLARTGAVPWVFGSSQLSLGSMGREAILAAAAVTAAMLLILPLLPAIEKFFGVTTAMTLLELADTNHPLLRRLALDAPGTFNHSLVLGALAEAVARQIDADALRCRVSAYYHDIGKLLKPDYFMENSNGGTNRHSRLSHTMSVLIVIGHVKDGLELAREYNLPAPIRQGIAEHHGTTIVEYFYQAACQKQAREAVTGGASNQVRDTEFRYPGPKPQSRETAVLMICDALEGIVRSQGELATGRIENTVHQLVMKRLLDGQFDECGLTMADLERIEHALSRALPGVYHGRTAYPAAEPLAQPA